MGNKGNKRHMKRYNLPKQFHIARKQNVFFMKTRPGPHPLKYSVPLGHLLRDLLKVAQTTKEVRFILNNKEVLIDGKVRRDHRFPVGFMDVISIPSINKYYRMISDKVKGLYPFEISKADSTYKLCQIKDKTSVKNGNIQLNLHDGRSILVEVKDPKKKSPVEYNTMGTLKIKIPSQEIVEYYQLEEKAQGFIYRGKNAGDYGTIIKIEKTFGINASLVNVESDQGIKRSTLYDYIFVTGKSKSAIKLPEMASN